MAKYTPSVFGSTTSKEEMVNGFLLIAKPAFSIFRLVPPNHVIFGGYGIMPYQPKPNFYF